MVCFPLDIIVSNFDSILRAGAAIVKQPRAQALLETSAAVISGLIKAFDDYEKSS